MIDSDPYKINQLLHPYQGSIYHGFAREHPFDLAEAVVSDFAARLTFTGRIDPARHPGYPFELDLAVTYLITAKEISITTYATNTGASAAPYAAGWHPYFRLPGTVDDWTLEIPARTIVRTDEALIRLRVAPPISLSTTTPRWTSAAHAS